MCDDRLIGIATSVDGGAGRQQIGAFGGSRSAEPQYARGYRGFDVRDELRERLERVGEECRRALRRSWYVRR